MPQLQIADAGSGQRKVLQVAVNDGSAQRTIKQAWIGDASGIAKLIYVLGDLLTMVAGENDANFIAGAPGYYHQGNSASWEGSLTPATLGDGSAVTALVSNANGQIQSDPGFWFLDIGPVAGYTSSNPLPQSYLSQLIVSGPGVGTVTLNASSATFTRNFATPGNGTWSWGGGLPAFAAGSTYNVTIVRSNP